MQQTDFVGYWSIVPVEGLVRANLFEGIECDHQDHDSILAGQELVFYRLGMLMPSFLGDPAVAGGVHLSKNAGNSSYCVPLTEGNVEVELTAWDDLGHFLKHWKDHYVKDRMPELATKFNGKSGVTFDARYRWRGNKGRGLQLGDLSGSSGNKNDSTSFQRVVNALCQGIELTPEVLYAEAGLRFPFSFSCDGTTKLELVLSDVSLESLKAADSQISEYMHWMQKNATTINTAIGFAEQARRSSLGAQEYMGDLEAGKVDLSLPGIMNFVGEHYLILAKHLLDQIEPLQNNTRMEYLAH